MRQFYRYLFQIRGDSWINYHWLWWALWMAQIYMLTIYNRIEANEASAIKNAQANLKTILPAVLIQAIQNKINTGDFFAKISMIICICKVASALETVLNSAKFSSPQRLFVDRDDTIKRPMQMLNQFAVHLETLIFF
jgi:hypothetical protein